MKNINNLFLKADEKCPDLIQEETIEKMNSFLDASEVEYTPANASAGERMPKIQVSKNGAKIDLTDHMSALSTQSQLIGKAKTRGDFGEGNMNMWHKVGVTYGTSMSLFVADIEEQ